MNLETCLVHLESLDFPITIKIGENKANLSEKIESLDQINSALIKIVATQFAIQMLDIVAMPHFGMVEDETEDIIPCETKEDVFSVLRTALHALATDGIEGTYYCTDRVVKRDSEYHQLKEEYRTLFPSIVDRLVEYLELMIYKSKQDDFFPDIIPSLDEETGQIYNW